ncbi:hypothetical protein EYF80_016536 [Liparis tanakae]|uniref:Uncharacterized protein n=1 Tax=Liparis tanakae TaxID=230148 RepID=A0A4Z2I6X3_9TELE|nr:hypothetical protein EYF80_016536 [Liparis tanakae]
MEDGGWRKTERREDFGSEEVTQLPDHVIAERRGQNAAEEEKSMHIGQRRGDEDEAEGQQKDKRRRGDKRGQFRSQRKLLEQTSTRTFKREHRRRRRRKKRRPSVSRGSQKQTEALLQKEETLEECDTRKKDGGTASVYVKTHDSHSTVKILKRLYLLLENEYSYDCSKGDEVHRHPHQAGVVVHQERHSIHTGGERGKRTCFLCSGDLSSHDPGQSCDRSESPDVQEGTCGLDRGVRQRVERMRRKKEEDTTPCVATLSVQCSDFSLISDVKLSNVASGLHYFQSADLQ